MNNLKNINSVYSTVQTLYAIDPNTDDFEDLVLVGWNRIGNKHTRLYRYVGNTENAELKLPCNVIEIESVHIPVADATVTSNTSDYSITESMLIENYIDAWKMLEDPYNQHGKLLKYKRGNNSLYFNRDYRNVMVVYHGIFVDEDGLPLVNDKEIDALASFVAYVETYKDGLRKRDKNIIAIAQDLKAEWLRRCNAARSVEYLSQNDMDAILDAKYRWDRKLFGKSHLPIL